MKKKVVVLFLIYVSIISSAQKPITTNTPCTDAMAMDAKGRWIKSEDLGSYNSKETNNRLDEIHNMVIKLFPQPTGVDVAWHRSAGVSYFGTKRKFYKTNDDRLTFDYLNKPH